MLLSRCTLVMSLVLLSWTCVEGHYYLSKALLHGAGVGMMLQAFRPRFMPIPIPFPTGLFSGFLRQYEQHHKEPEKKPVVHKDHQPQIIIIQAHQPEPVWF
ncbi:hypothetical protein JTE90_004780 [Oedothorax gibbosus]|uniref:Secreted protein n=1 Tax=Oedothorax gibbosus TaxID=931172 RepID=A0AAV6VIQ1_9ARAC|nr:hypothetical protein JTE90_004780 [Oedothorax gibbosus]